MDYSSLSAKHCHNHLAVCKCQLAYSSYTVFIQLVCSCFTDKKHFTDIKRPQNIHEIFTRNNGCSIRLFIIAAHLREDFVKGDSCRKSEAEFLFHSLADSVCDFPAGSEQLAACRHIQPGFVYTEGLHHIREAQVDVIDHPAVVLIFVMVRGNHLKIRTFFPRLPESFCSYNAVFFSDLVFCQYDAVTIFGAAAYRHRLIFQLRVVEKFD